MSVERLLHSVPVPDVARVRQRFERPILANVESELRTRIRGAGVMHALKPAQTVAIAVGSRGIGGLSLLVRTLVDEIVRAGAVPFIVPAMGSHGGATAAGQVRVLAGLGVTQDTVGAPVVSSMKAVEIGRTPTQAPVFLDEHALFADAVVVVNTIKPHVGFRGTYESGLIKMITIGLGKQVGADACHDLGYEHMAENIVAMARVTLRRINLLCGVGVIENAYGDVCHLAVLRGNEIEGEEPALLNLARALAPRLPFDEIDVLIVDEIGKDIAGTGLDTNVIGRFHTPVESGGPNITRIVVLDVTTKSEGNANGIGLADFTTRRAFDKIQFEQMYPNSLTTTVPATSKIPMILGNDRLAIQAAIKTCNSRDKSRARLVRIRNTKTLDVLYSSAALLEEVGRHPALVQCEAVCPMAFDADGNLS